MALAASFCCIQVYKCVCTSPKKYKPMLSIYCKLQIMLLRAW